MEKKNYRVKKVKINLYPETEWRDKFKNEGRREGKEESFPLVSDVLCTSYFLLGYNTMNKSIL